MFFLPCSTAKLRGRRSMISRTPIVATVALANKNARIVWALLAQGRTYQSDYALAACKWLSGTTGFVEEVFQRFAQAIMT